MNLKFIDRVIESYREGLEPADLKRLEYFRGLWEVMDRWTGGPSAASRSYNIPANEALEAAWTDDKPVFALAAPALKRDRFCAICSALCEYVCESGILSEEDTKVLSEVDFISLVSRGDMAVAASDPDRFLGLLLGKAIEQGASGGVARLVALVGMLALRVDFEPIARQVRKAQKRADLVASHFPLRCPVCGSAPSLARVGGADSPTEGRGRTLYCAQCGSDWTFQRVRCARCGTQNQGHLHYFNIEGDDAHRIHKCDECGDYMRTVFIEDALRPFSYEVEEVISARFDAIARDLKFQEKR